MNTTYRPSSLIGLDPRIAFSVACVTPSLRTGDVILSLLGCVAVYSVFGGFGFYYIYKLLLRGPGDHAEAISNATPSRPLAFADTEATATGSAKG